jgi:glyoxylase-like metal-dependent hydrolase (beta-lactamase superfamily II)
MVRRVFAGRGVFHDGSEELAPGISVHHMGGHTSGIQAVRVRTRRGYMVLASDVTHFYANIEEARPFPAVQDVFAGLEAFAKLKRLASSPDMIIPGHDPLVLRRYPRLRKDVPDIVRLDADPLA